MSGVPYKESIEKARNLMLSSIITTIGGKDFDCDGGYLVGGCAESFTAAWEEEPRERERLIYRVAKWIDALPTNVPFLLSRIDSEIKAGPRFYVYACTYHASLWDAEVTALTRDRNLAYDCRNGTWITL